MTDFEIKNLTGDWAKWAKEADEHEKGQKDSKINSAFEENYVLNAAFNAGKTVEEVSEILGADFGQRYQDKLTANNANIDKKSQTAEDAEEDVLKNFVATAGAKYAEKPDWKTLAEDLKADILSPDKNLTNRGYYTTLTKQIDAVATSLAKFKYKNRDEVKDLYDKVKDDLNLNKKDNDKFREFKLEVLEKMVLIAEAHQQSKELKEIGDYYKALRGGTKVEGDKILDGTKRTREEAYEIIQNSEKFKGSYFHDYTGRDYDDKITKFHKGLIHQFEDSTIMNDARKVVFDAIEAQRRKHIDDPRSSRQVEKDVIVDLKARNEYDDYTQKVLGGELSFRDKMSFARSNVKAHRKEIATNEKVEHNKTIKYTEKDLKDEVRKDVLINSLINNGLITERAGLNQDNEKTYDITNLSDMIRERVGANLIASKQPGDLYPYSEVENIVKDLMAKGGIQAISQKDTRRIIEDICGFEVIGKNWVKILVNAVADTVIPTAATALSVASMTKQVFDKTYPVEVNITNDIFAELNLKINGGEAKLNKFDLIKSLQASGFGKGEFEFIEDGNGGFKLILNKTVTNSYEGDPIKFHEEFSKRAGSIALRTALIAFAMNVMQQAFNDKNGQELPEIVTQFAHTSIQDYKNEIDVDKKLTPAQKKALQELAEAFIKRDEKGKKVLNANGEPIWEVEKFKSLLDNIAGSSSMLDKSEFHIGITRAVNEYKEKLAKILAEQALNDKIKEETETITTEKVVTEGKVLTVPHEWKHNESWQAIIATYYPEAFEDHKNNLKPLVDAFRDAQGISRRSGIPVGQTLNLDVITVNGKTYSPKADDGTRLKTYTDNKWFGWGSKYYSGDWKYPTEGVSTATGKERKSEDSVKYKATRESDKKEAEDENQIKAQDKLRPEARDGVETTVTVKNIEGQGSYEYQVEAKKKEEKTEE